MGVFALKEVAAEGKGGKNFAVAGIVLGCVYIVTLTVIAVVKGRRAFEHDKGELKKHII